MFFLLHLPEIIYFPAMSNFYATVPTQRSIHVHKRRHTKSPRQLHHPRRPLDRLRNPPPRSRNPPGPLRRHSHRNVRRSANSRRPLRGSHGRLPHPLRRRHHRHGPLRPLRSTRRLSPPRRKIRPHPLSTRRLLLPLGPSPRHNPRHLHPDRLSPLNLSAPPTFRRTAQPTHRHFERSRPTFFLSLSLLRTCRHAQREISLPLLRLHPLFLAPQKSPLPPRLSLFPQTLGLPTQNRRTRHPCRLVQTQ